MNKLNTILELINVSIDLPIRDCKCLVKLKDGTYRFCDYLFDGKSTDDIYAEREGMLGCFYVKQDYQGVDYIILNDVEYWAELVFWGVDLAEAKE